MTVCKCSSRESGRRLKQMQSRLKEQTQARPTEREREKTERLLKLPPGPRERAPKHSEHPTWCPDLFFLQLSKHHAPRSMVFRFCKRASKTSHKQRLRRNVCGCSLWRRKRLRTTSLPTHSPATYSKTLWRLKVTKEMGVIVAMCSR